MQLVTLKDDFCVKELFENELVRKHFISDVLQIPLEEIRSVRILNPFLRKRHRYQKTGILDILLELNNSVKINIELQIRTSKHWDQRQLFYLSKMYTAELRTGQDYTKLKRCVAISILDFNLTDSEEYHRVYKFRDEKGYLFSNMLEVHILELGKKLTGKPVDDWIRLFNAKSMEELDMIRTKNPGIREAIRELKHFSLLGELRDYFEVREKARRDRQAQDEYVYEQGMEHGMEHRIEAMILLCRDVKLSRKEAFNNLKEKFQLTDAKAEEYMKKYWNEKL